MKKKKIELKRIDVEKLLTILDKLIKDRESKRGRPPIYRESLIYFAIAIKQIFRLSWRDLEYHLHFILKKEKIPDFTTLFYRANQIDKEILKKSINYIAVQIISKIGKIDKLITDGTGFGYDDTYYQSWERGKRLKEVKTHIKTQVIIGTKDDISIPIAVETGISYADERKLLKKIIQEIPLDKGNYIIGDKLYGMDNELAKRLIEEIELVPVIPVKEGVRNKIRSFYRKRLKEIYEENKEVYRERYRVEQLFGKIKNAYGDRDNTRKYDLACVFVLMRFLIYNIAILLAVLFLLVRFFKHTNR